METSLNFSFLLIDRWANQLKLCVCVSGGGAGILFRVHFTLLSILEIETDWVHRGFRFQGKSIIPLRIK